MKCSSPDTAHYLGAIRARLDQLYEEHPNDPALREQISDEVDWIDATIERPAGLAQGRVPPGFVLIPQSALDWLDGSAPAPDGKWFGQDAPDPDEKPYRAYWWRSRFRELCSVPSTERGA